ncbi:putative sulfate exporter family transporter [Alphaproteobacteria bacterium]|nr:putative sulfate exporter family transporter [Alphaproteobacteria bacterium]
MLGFFFCSGIFVSIYLSFIFLINPLGISFFSVSILCIISGILLNNFTNLSHKLNSGIQFSKKNLLQIGIVFLGLRLSFYEVGELGLMALPIILITFMTVFFLSYFLIKFYSSQKNIITLIAIGTAICGITAILTSAPFSKAKDNEIAYATFVITIIGTIALFIYPYLSHEIFSNNSHQVGIFLGTSVHDTSQVIASSFIYATHYGNIEVINISTVTKLLRNTFLIILIPTLAWKYSNLNNSNFFQNIQIAFPKFVIGFLLFSVMRSLGDFYFTNLYSLEYWDFFLQFFNILSFVVLNIALVALGLSVDLQSIKKIGFRPLYIGLVISLIILLVNILLIKSLII